MIFLLAFLPLIFGGKIYNVLERMMAVKLVIVLGFLVSVAIFLISPHNAWEVFAGFFRFGQVALRAETVIAGPHFDVRMREGSALYIIKGTYEGNKGAYEGNKPVVTQLGTVDEERHRTNWFDVSRPLPANIASDEERLLARIGPLAKPGRFLVETTRKGKSFRISGEITAQGEWFAEHVVTQEGKSRPVDQSPADLTGRDKELVAEFVQQPGIPTRRTRGILERARRTSPARLAAAGRALRHRGGRHAVQRALFELCARQGLGNGCADRSDSQRHRRPSHRLEPRRQGVHRGGGVAGPLARLVSPHFARSGHLDDVQLHRYGLALHDVAGVHPQRAGLGKPRRRTDGRWPRVAISRLRHVLVGHHAVHRLYRVGSQRRLRGRFDRPALDRLDLDRKRQSQRPARTQRHARSITVSWRSIAFGAWWPSPS